MATSFNEIAQEARALAAEDRAKLAETLLDSLQVPLSEIETAWAQEIERLVAAFDRSEMSACAAEDVLAAAVEDATARALAFPLAGPPATKNTRRVSLKNFPFAVVYRPDADGITTFALAHRSRRLGYWQLRTRNR